MVKKDSVFVDTIKDYLPSDIRDVNHDTEIEHIYYMESKQHLIVMERDAKRFKVLEETVSFSVDCECGRQTAANSLAKVVDLEVDAKRFKALEETVSFSVD